MGVHINCMCTCIEQGARFQVAENNIGGNNVVANPPSLGLMYQHALVPHEFSVLFVRGMEVHWPPLQTSQYT